MTSRFANRKASAPQSRARGPRSPPRRPPASPSGRVQAQACIPVDLAFESAGVTQLGLHLDDQETPDARAERQQIDPTAPRPSTISRSVTQPSPARSSTRLAAPTHRAWPDHAGVDRRPRRESAPPGELGVEGHAQPLECGDLADIARFDHADDGLRHAGGRPSTARSTRSMHHLVGAGQELATGGARMVGGEDAGLRSRQKADSGAAGRQGTGPEIAAVGTTGARNPLSDVVSERRASRPRRTGAAEAALPAAPAAGRPPEGSPRPGRPVHCRRDRRRATGRPRASRGPATAAASGTRGRRAGDRPGTEPDARRPRGWPATPRLAAEVEGLLLRRWSRPAESRSASAWSILTSGAAGEPRDDLPGTLRCDPSRGALRRGLDRLACGRGGLVAGRRCPPVAAAARMASRSRGRREVLIRAPGPRAGLSRCEDLRAQLVPELLGATGGRCRPRRGASSGTSGSRGAPPPSGRGGSSVASSSTPGRVGTRRRPPPRWRSVRRDRDLSWEHSKRILTAIRRRSVNWLTRHGPCREAYRSGSRRGSGRASSSCGRS